MRWLSVGVSTHRPKTCTIGWRLLIAHHCVCVHARFCVCPCLCVSMYLPMSICVFCDWLVQAWICTCVLRNVLLKWDFCFVKKDKLSVGALKFTFAFAGKAVPYVSRWQHAVVLSTSFIYTRWIVPSCSRCPQSKPIIFLIKLNKQYIRCFSQIYLLILTLSPFYLC